MSDKNVAIARQWFETIWNQRQVEKLHEFLTEDSICYSERGELKGIEPFVTQSYQPFIAAFPDLRVEVQQTVAEGDQVVVCWEVSGTHTGEGLGFAPSGRSFRSHGMTWIRFANGKMMEGRDCWNLGGLVASLQ